MSEKQADLKKLEEIANRTRMNVVKMIAYSGLNLARRLYRAMILQAETITRKAKAKERSAEFSNNF
ncbi:MAG: hypothetical protein ACYTEL_15160 [Planctomycetota bacterium]|jgi:hypothetical protein